MEFALPTGSIRPFLPLSLCRSCSSSSWKKKNNKKPYKLNLYQTSISISVNFNTVQDKKSNGLYFYYFISSNYWKDGAVLSEQNMGIIDYS